VFPTCVGMNRITLTFNLSMGGVPHVCGDEPWIEENMCRD